VILIIIFSVGGGAGGEDRTGGGVHGSLPGHRGQHRCQGGRQDQVLSPLLSYLYPAVSSYRCHPNLSSLERLKEKSTDISKYLYASKSALLCGIE
jgi:hypothetical protein